MCPLGIERIWGSPCTIYTISSCLNLFSFTPFNLLHLGPFSLLVKSISKISPSTTNLHDQYFNLHSLDPHCFFESILPLPLVTMRKSISGVLQLNLQLNFWVASDTCNSPYIWCNSLQLNYNLDAITPFQLLCNSLMNTIIMSCWHHFSSIHQNLTHGTMRIFLDFFEILISIIHYDYSF
jgi:hypothetical protein